MVCKTRNVCFLALYTISCLHHVLNTLVLPHLRELECGHFSLIRHNGVLILGCVHVWMLLTCGAQVVWAVPQSREIQGARWAWMLMMRLKVEGTWECCVCTGVSKKVETCSCHPQPPAPPPGGRGSKASLEAVTILYYKVESPGFASWDLHIKKKNPNLNTKCWWEAGRDKRGLKSRGNWVWFINWQKTSMRY